MYQNRFLNFSASFYNWIVRIGSNLQSLFLLWMRLTWGHQLVLAGLKKHQNIQETVDFFTTLHIVHPDLTAYLVAYLEILGGACLALGIASRLIAIPLAITMIAAIRLAHWETLAGFQILTNPLNLVMQEPYPFLITALIVLLFGPGRISVDAWLKNWASKQPQF